VDKYVVGLDFGTESVRALVVEYQGLRQDNNLRRNTTLEKLASLRPAFPMQGSATLSAGNSTPMMTRAGTPTLISRWRRWREVVCFVDVLFRSRRAHVSATDR